MDSEALVKLAELREALSSQERGVMLKALDEIVKRGWNANGVLKKTRLYHAKLVNVGLINWDMEEIWWSYADMSGSFIVNSNLDYCDLQLATMEGVCIYDSSFRGSVLSAANMKNAHFLRVNFTGAKFVSTTFELARLINTNLRNSALGAASFAGADLTGSNLENATLTAMNNYDREFSAVFDETTVLPDGTFWSSQVDLRQFTDRTHPQFWRSDNPDSPAYRGK